MRRISIAAGLLVLAGCSSPLPAPDPGKAWVEPFAVAGELLMADKLDGKRWDDGRYFEVSPGAHELISRFQFEVNGGGGYMSEPTQVTCEIRLRYDSFAAGQHYRLEARSLMRSAQAFLYDEQRNELARGEVLRCGTF